MKNKTVLSFALYFKSVKQTCYTQWISGVVVVAVVSVLSITLGAKTTPDYIFYSALFAVVLALIPIISISAYKKNFKKQFSSGTIEREGLIEEYVFDENGFTVTESYKTGEERSVCKCKWVEVIAAVEHKGCLYIAINKSSFFLIDGGGMVDCRFDELTALVKSAIAPKKYKVRKRF
jgi:hypothetical protein